MLDQSITTPPPATTGTQLTLSELIEAARDKTRIAARIAESFENLSDVSFRDLDLIARNCYSAGQTLEEVSRALSTSESAAATGLESESDAGQVTALQVSASQN